MFNVANLTVVSTRFLIGMLVVTFACWLFVLRRLRRRSARRRPWRGAALVAAASLLSVAFVADCVNSYYSYLPNVSDVVDALVSSPPQSLTPAVNQVSVPPSTARGRLFQLPVPDHGSGFGRSMAWVWLPPQYFEQPRVDLPVVYLFHGSPGMPRDWFHGGAAGRTGQLLAAEKLPVIMVAPQMSKNWLDDPECVDGLHEKIETHLLRDVIPAVDQQLRTERNRTGRIFAGMSAGGYCALNLGLRHPELTATVLDLSGYTVPTHSGGMASLFGRGNAAAVAQNSPASYADRLTGGPPMRIWLDCGSSDRTVLRQLNAISASLRRDGMVVEQHSRPGDHSYSVWRPALKQSLAWALADRPATIQPASSRTQLSPGAHPMADRRISSTAP
ncbi:MAG TPA: alpha/beta hydrolase-fold protein [Jatrophihabitans sp.]|nr:alpha/beta hydrolase-fold protein [Jatrophihabitans sp.]